MKRLAIAAAVVLFAACAAQDEAAPVDSLATPPAMAPAPAPAMDSAAMDSTMMDSTTVDTTTPPPAGE